MHWKSVFLQTSYVEILTAKVIVFVGRPLGGDLWVELPEWD